MSRKYFSKLNYTLANEDTALELAMVKKLQPKRTLAVCGSGGRSLPLVVGTSQEVVCTDLSEPQLLLAKHKKAAIETLSHQEYLLYWGFPPFETTENRRVREELFEKLPLDGETLDFFGSLYRELDWAGLLYEGKWEKTFTGVPKLLRRVVGGRYDDIFDFKSFEEQKAYFDRELNSKSWVIVPRLVLRAFGNAAFFNAFLYKGHFVKKNVPETHYEYYRQAYRSLFYQDLTKTSFFLQLTFLGKLVHPEGNTVEAQPGPFAEMKKKFETTKVQFLAQDLLAVAETSKEKFDFVSLSDVPSYFSAHQDQVYLQRLSQGLNPGAHVVVRCYLRVPENTDLTGFRDVTDRWATQVAAEKTQIYRTFIYEYQG